MRFKLGATDVQIAEFFGTSEQTLNAWKRAHPEFLESMAKGKIAADAEIADKLYHRARGYSHEAVKIFMPAGANAPVYAPCVEHYPPDTQASIGGVPRQIVSDNLKSGITKAVLPPVVWTHGRRYGYG